MAQQTANIAVSLTTASSRVLASRDGTGMKRTQFIITNLSATTVTIAKGENSATANQGIILSQGQAYIESTDGGFECWQGEIQGVGSAASTLSVVEGFTPSQ